MGLKTMFLADETVEEFRSYIQRNAGVPENASIAASLRGHLAEDARRRRHYAERSRKDRLDRLSGE